MTIQRRRPEPAMLAVVAALCVVTLGTGPAGTQPDAPAAATDGPLSKPFGEFAASKGLDAQALAAELGLPDGVDVEQPLSQVLTDHDLSQADLQAGMQALTGGADSPVASAEPIDPDAAMKLPFRDFAEAKGVAPEKLAQALGLPERTDLSSPLGVILKQHGLSRTDVQAAMVKANPLAAQAAGKNWGRIRLKFALWAGVFLAAMILLATVKITKPIRATMLAAAALIFGVWLGVEPNAPGTVKDGLVLYGEEGVIFRPRLIAFAGFLLMTIIGNKVFCGWGCQFGTLQDLFWQVQTRKLTPPFWLSNLVRASFFVALTVAALVVPIDIMEPIDPFRIFRLGAAAAVGLAVVGLVASIWVYRPWCTFMCPFGFLSWFAERISFWRPRVNHNICIDCKRCERACPTHSMAGIRAGRPFPQDCFACGACVSVCPVSAVRWGLSPPPDKAEPDAVKKSDEVPAATGSG